MQRNLRESLVVFVRALVEALKQSIGRLTLWLSCHGVVLPWNTWAETCVSNSTLERYRRRALVAHLRVQRYRIARGPYFLRSLLDSTLTLVRFMQFPSLVAIKLFLALLMCLLPFLIFFAIRIYLPVAQRIPQLESSVDLEVMNSTEAVVPRVFRQLNVTLMHANSQAQEVNEDSFFSFKQLDARSGEGFLIQGKGSAHEEFRRGWRLSQAEELVVTVAPQREARNLNLQFRPIPDSGKPAQCKLHIVNANGQVVFASSFDTLLASRFSLLKTPLARGLQEKLMPDFAMNRARLSSDPVSIPMSAGESQLSFRMERIDKGEDNATCSALLHNFEWSGDKISAPQTAVRKSMLMLLFQSMNADVASDSKRMPWLSGFLKSSATMQFNQHHAIDVRSDESFKSLLGFSGGQGISPTDENYNYIEKLRRKGYRIVFVGDFDSPDSYFTRVVPDVAVRIDNETYDARLTLSQAMNLLAHEANAPVFMLVRLRGMSAPWRPFFSDLNLKEVFFGGDARGVMDALVFAHLRTLDSELARFFGDFEQNGVLSKFDFLVTAERGFDLGYNLIFSDPIKPTFSSDLLLNQETLRVPLGIRLADVSPEGLPFHLKNQNTMSSHNDLTRTLWEGLGVLDAKYPAESRRLWGRGDALLARRSRMIAETRETDVVVRMLPVRSRLQEGVLFADPDSAGGFLKYVAQPLPSRISAPDAYGWPEKNALDFQAGEQFRHVSRRGQKEEVIFRVNNKFVREARRIIRKERNFPLRLRLTSHATQSIDFVFEQKTTGDGVFLSEVSPALKLTTTQVDAQTLLHRLTGTFKEGESFDLKGGGNTFRVVEHRGEGILVACPEAFVFSLQGLSSALAQKTVCLLENPERERLENLKNSGKKAISFWLVEDENQICKLQDDYKGGSEEYSECLESAPHDEGRR
ncbi:MAG: LTA synthase family protein [Betaproteobacteria bacterium]|nr:LTA synthase family protein [Betaproteobacteria bacterium]